MLRPVNLTNSSPLPFSSSVLEHRCYFRSAFPRGSRNGNKLITAVEHLYRIVITQYLHNARRLPVANNSPQPLPGVITNPNVQRLYQSATATYILVTLLASMLVCTSVIVLTFNPQGLLNKRPTSIAAQASLVAGSTMLEILPQSAEKYGNEELKQLEVFQGLNIKLRWWGDGKEGVTYGIDVE